ncbi:unnamed protein product [Closterium sp. Yama58-4]|nr:unnamed protein product [Closterium sp. Yama58-4]
MAPAVCVMHVASGTIASPPLSHAPRALPLFSRACLDSDAKPSSSRRGSPRRLQSRHGSAPRIYKCAISSHHPLSRLPAVVLDMAQQQRERAQEREPSTSEMLSEHEETRKREFESQPGEVKEVTVTAPGGGGSEKGGAPGAPSVEGAATGEKEAPSATEKGAEMPKGEETPSAMKAGAEMLKGEETPSAMKAGAEMPKGEEGSASRGTTKQGDDMPTTAAGRMGGGVAAPEVPIRMRDVLPEGEVEAGALDMPVTKMDAAAKQREETAEFGGPVKGVTAAALQSAADKNVQAGVVPPLGAELASAKAAEATAQGRKLGAA